MQLNKQAQGRRMARGTEQSPCLQQASFLDTSVKHKMFLNKKTISQNQLYVSAQGAI